MKIMPIPWTKSHKQICLENFWQERMGIRNNPIRWRNTRLLSRKVAAYAVLRLFWSQPLKPSPFCWRETTRIQKPYRLKTGKAFWVYVAFGSWFRVRAVSRRLRGLPPIQISNAKIRSRSLCLSQPLPKPASQQSHFSWDPSISDQHGNGFPRLCTWWNPLRSLASLPQTPYNTAVRNIAQAII